MKNWLWINTAPDISDTVWKQRFSHIKAAGIDAILPEIFNNHVAAYQSNHLPIISPWLEQILPLAHQAGLEVHAWTHMMCCNIPEIYEQHPEWYVVNGKGESAADNPAYVDYYKFLCPSRPEVHEFLQRRIAELATYDTLTGIHLDYIRFPDVILAADLQPKYNIVQDREYPQYDYCYCEVCRADFVTQYGIDPTTLENPSTDAHWRQFRYDLISKLVNEILVPPIHAQNKTATAAVFPNWQHVRQEWSTWNIDAVLPMLYHGFYQEDLQWITQCSIDGVRSLPNNTPLYSGLYIPDLEPAELGLAIKAAMAGKAGGVALFSANAMNDIHWQTLAQTRY